MTCICIDDLSPASFRGAAFFVYNDKSNYGRRIVTHEYPMRDDPYNEDLGEKAQKFNVSGYLVGDDWKSQRDALVAACRARGPALLQLPTSSPGMVVCNHLSVSRTKDECGLFAVEIEFTSAKNFGVPSAIGVAEVLIGQVFNDAIAPLTMMFDAAYIGADILQYATDRQIQRVLDFAGAAISAVESNVTQSDVLSANVVREAISLFQNADTYVAPDDSEAANLLSQPEVSSVIAKLASPTGFIQVADAGITITQGASTIVPLIAAVVNNIGNAMLPADAAAALLPLAQWSSSEITLADLEARQTASGTSTPGSKPLGPTDVADATNARVFCGVVRSFALMKLAQAISAKTFTYRAEAIQARATVVELFNMQIAQFDEDEIANLMLKARDLAVNAISKSMASIVPVLTIRAPQPRPSLYWAGRLYEDAARAEELADRNSIKQPAFMPIQFEALARR